MTPEERETSGLPRTAAARLVQVMRHLGGIPKESKHREGWKYRGIDDVLKIIHPAMSDAGLVLRPRLMRHAVVERMLATNPPRPTTIVEVVMEWDFLAEDGSMVTVGPVHAEALSLGALSIGAAMSQALKIMILQLFVPPCEDTQDADRQDHENPPRPSYPSHKPMNQQQDERETLARKQAAAEQSVQVAPPPAKKGYAITTILDMPTWGLAECGKYIQDLCAAERPAMLAYLQNIVPGALTLSGLDAAKQESLKVGLAILAINDQITAHASQWVARLDPEQRWPYALKLPEFRAAAWKAIADPTRRDNPAAGRQQTLPPIKTASPANAGPLDDNDPFPVPTKNPM